MSAHSEGELNPYAPPSTDAGAPISSVKPRRPASTKWALFLVGSGTVMRCYFNFLAVSEHGWIEVLESELSDGGLLLLLLLLSFGLLFFCKPSPWSHIVVSFFLGKTLLNGVSSAITGDSSLAMQEPVSLWITLALLAWLFWAFAFGKASHTYYGVKWLFRRHEESVS